MSRRRHCHTAGMHLPRLRYRVGFWVTVLIVAALFRIFLEMAPDHRLQGRHASMAEWSQTIEELAAEQMALRLPVVGEPQPHRGMLVWWYDPREERERFSYLAAPDEDDHEAVMKLGSALKSGDLRVAPPPQAGMDVLERMLDSAPADGLPPRWTVLMPPEGWAADELATVPEEIEMPGDSLSATSDTPSALSDTTSAMGDESP